MTPSVLLGVLISMQKCDINRLKISGLLKRVDQNCKRMIANNTSTPKEVLQILADENDLNILAEVALNPSTPASVLEEFSKSDHGYIQECVGRNPSTPVEVLEQLSYCDNGWIQRGLIRNPSTPKSIVKRLYVYGTSFTSTEAALRLEKNQFKQD